MFWCFCGEAGLGLLTLLGIFVLAENIGLLLKILGGILIAGIFMGMIFG